MNNIKQGRISSQVMREVSNILLLEAKDDTLKHVTVTGCEVTNDLSWARVYYTYMGEESAEAVALNLKEAAPWIRTVLADRLGENLRHIPEIRFIVDESIEYGNKIEKLIDKIHEKDEL
ncbi:MAG: 30S ribosome-binding factor RbfA [Bacilli bacterium]|nr:30S ribosome-binding factor RbfA [Bacilli bacterium]